MLEELQLHDDEILLAPGDSLVFYTDGVTERRGAAAMFGDENLLAVLSRSLLLSAPDMARALEAAVAQFAAGSLSARDDLAVLVVRAA